VFQAKYDRLIIRCITKVTRRFASMVSQDDVREVYANLYVSLLGNDMHKLRTFDPERGNRFSSWAMIFREPTSSRRDRYFLSGGGRLRLAFHLTIHSR